MGKFEESSKLFPTNATDSLPVAALADVAEYTGKKIIHRVAEKRS